ncbi:hypothetical protein H5158_22585, partial [Pseudoalteromonas sp. SR45-6]|nr:hypothetical protein [Pseudoalteromonas sp. SR45-6]MBB1471370.1 hypothetical protein [Pseudoalteromonas sp. SG41-5]
MPSPFIFAQVNSSLRIRGSGFTPRHNSPAAHNELLFDDKANDSNESMEAAIAVLRKLGKGDPVKYLREINWQNLGKQAASEVKAVIKG